MAFINTSFSMLNKGPDEISQDAAENTTLNKLNSTFYNYSLGGIVSTNSTTTTCINPSAPELRIVVIQYADGTSEYFEYHDSYDDTKHQVMYFRNTSTDERLAVPTNGINIKSWITKPSAIKG